MTRAEVVGLAIATLQRSVGEAKDAATLAREAGLVTIADSIDDIVMQLSEEQDALIVSERAIRQRGQ